MKKQPLRDTVFNRVNFNTANAATMTLEAFLELHKDEWPDISEEERKANLTEVHKIASEAVKKTSADGNNNSGNATALSGGEPGTGSGKGGSTEPGSAGGLQPAAAKEGKGK